VGLANSAHALFLENAHAHDLAMGGARLLQDSLDVVRKGKVAHIHAVRIVGLGTRATGEED
jgi:hypothetical protein